jgi:fimbrial chaperone protein
VLAGTFSISPVRLDLSAAATTGALTVRNEEATTVVVQADVLAWEQAGGEDQLAATREVLVSPAVFTLPPNGTQLVRVALRRSADAQRELSYRLSLTEVPQPASPDFNGLKVSLHLSLPVFVAAASATPAQLAWSARTDGQGRVVVSAANAGGTHARILNFSVAPADGSAQAVSQPAAAYVLAGQTRSWTLDDEQNDKTHKGTKLADARNLRLKGNTDQGEIATELVLER